MSATLRHRLIRVPARLVRHAGTLTLRLPPGYDLLADVLTRIRVGSRKVIQANGGVFEDQRGVTWHYWVPTSR